MKARQTSAAATLARWPHKDQWSEVTWKLLHQDAQRPLPVTNSLSQDQATIAQRKANAPLKPRKEQVACNHGLFSDDSLQRDLNLIVEMFQEPVED